jgi:glycosyltransferase involved in cell wall biosynthesis
MKVLLSHDLPFALAHGGIQVQIEQTWKALEAIGVAVEPLRWWDPNQSAQILHSFGRIQASTMRFAQGKGMKVVATAYLAGLGARPAWQRTLQKRLLQVGRSPWLARFTDETHWRTYQHLDACITATPWEATLLCDIHGAPRARTHVVPNGVEEVFFAEGPRGEGEWLVCTASIIELKQVLKLAQAAVLARVPLWVIGKPLADASEYARRFGEYAAAHSQLIRYEGAVEERPRLARIYREARGFVLLSTMESLSLSALEAAAAGCPLLLSDLPWARTTFGGNAAYCSHRASLKATAEALRQFSQSAPHRPRPPQPCTWREVAARLKTIYESLLSSSR